MQKSHYIAIASAAILIPILFFLGNTVPPAKPLPAGMGMPAVTAGRGQTPSQTKPIELDKLISLCKNKLPKQALQELDLLENSLKTVDDTRQMMPVFKQMSVFWEKNNENRLSTYYKSKIGQLDNSEKELTFAAQLFLELMQNESEPSVQAWEVQQALVCLEQSTKIDPDNEETKLALATCYLEGTGEPMAGVQILLGIVNKKPDDIPANLLLGRMSLKSGQLDKAVARFNIVLKQEPSNVEALLQLAQVFKEKGDKNKAIELLEKSKLIVNKPEFSNDIDKEINSLK